MIYQKIIAEKAGVSEATVSRAMNQSANVSPKTLRKIQETMKSLGLQPLTAISPVPKSKSGYVLVMAGDIANYFFSLVIKGICDQLVREGLLPVVCNSNYDERMEEQQILRAEKNNYLGIIMVTAMEHPILTEVIRDIDTPLVMVNRYIHSIETHTVCIDNYMGGYVAATHLVENGHRRIAYFASLKGSTPQEDRIHGFFDAIKELQISDFHCKVFYGTSGVERGRQLALTLVRQGMPYSAIFVADCQIAVGVVNALNDFGYCIPDNISILCFDDSPYINEAGLCLSTVKYDPYAMGRTAVNTLIQNLGRGHGEDKAHVVLMPQLLRRRSVRKIPNHTQG